MRRFTVIATALPLLMSGNASADMLTDAVKEIGIKTCLAAIGSASKSHLEKADYGYHNIWATKDPDKAMFSSLVVKDYSDGDSHISIVASPRGDGCDIQWTETYVQEQACPVLCETLFRSFEFGGEVLGGSIQLTNDAMSVYLTPSESGKACLVTRRELVLGYPVEL